MPRYFFNLSDGHSPADLEGVEFPDPEAARRAATRYLGQSLADHPDEYWRRGDWELIVTDASGLTLYRLQVVATEAPSIQATSLPNPAR